MTESAKLSKFSFSFPVQSRTALPTVYLSLVETIVSYSVLKKEAVCKLKKKRIVDWGINFLSKTKMCKYLKFSKESEMS